MRDEGDMHNPPITLRYAAAVLGGIILFYSLLVAVLVLIG